MKLHELVSNACKEDDLDPLTARSRKLACHVALLRELSASNAFGPLNSIMVSVSPPPFTTLYSPRTHSRASFSTRKSLTPSPRNLPRNLRSLANAIPAHFSPRAHRRVRYQS